MKNELLVPRYLPHVPVGRRLRRKLASIRPLANTWHLALTLQDELRRRPVTQSQYTKIFAARADPWKYEVTGFEFAKFQAAVELLDKARNGELFKRAWEIGCAEGAL